MKIRKDNVKILILTSSFPIYKGELSGNFIYELAKGLMGKGFGIVVLGSHHHEAKLKEDMAGLKIYRFPYFYPFKYQNIYLAGGIAHNLKRSHLAKMQAPLFFLSELFYAIKIIRKEKIDAIHSHWLLPQGLVGAICRKIFGIPHIMTVHGTDVLKIKKSKILCNIGSFILKKSDKITANSNYTKDVISSIESKIKNNVEVIPMGIDTKRFNPKNDANLKNIFEAEYLILTVGRLVERKGIKYLIMAMKEVVKEFPKAKLIIGGLGPEKGKLEKVTENLNLKENVIFAGYIENSDLPKYYVSSDISVLPAITVKGGDIEGLGLVLLEAMACGTPVIGSNVGGIADIIKDGYNGFLVPEKSPKDLADKIIELLSNRKLAEEFSVTGLKTVGGRFSWDIVSERFISIYEMVKNENRIQTNKRWIRYRNID